MANSTFQNYDMSRLLNPVELNVKPVKEVTEDVIDSYISKMELDKHPELLDGLMTELGLFKFWSKLNSTPEKYSVLLPIAANRMLNFYEGATRGGLHIRQIRMGMVVCAMTATFLSDYKDELRISYEGSATYMACFAPVGVCSLKDFDIGALEEKEIKSVQRMVKLFSKRVPTKVQLAEDRLGDYLLAAMRMWVVSDNVDVLNIMKSPKTRDDYLNDEATWAPGVKWITFNGGIETYNQMDVTSFTLPWSRAKSIKLNAVARFRAMKAAN